MLNIAQQVREHQRLMDSPIRQKILADACVLIKFAEAWGYTLTIESVSKHPPAMGNTMHVATVVPNRKSYTNP